MNSNDKSVLLLLVLRHQLTQGERAIGFAARATEAVALAQTTYSDYTIVSMIQVKDVAELTALARDRFGVADVLPIEGPDIGVFGVKSVDTSATEALPSFQGGRRHKGNTPPAPIVGEGSSPVITPTSSAPKE